MLHGETTAAASALEPSSFSRSGESRTRSILTIVRSGNFNFHAGLLVAGADRCLPGREEDRTGAPGDGT